MPKIYLDENHIYTVDGVVLPSVSAIMKPLTDGFYSDIDEDVLENAKLRGTLIHESVENFNHFGSYDPEAEPYMKQYKKWIDKVQPAVIHNELMLTNGEYCGTIDMYCLIGGEYVLVDVKTTSKITESLLEVQLAAYTSLLHENGFQVDKTMVLQLTPKGYKYQNIPVNHWKWRELVDAFKKNKGS